MYLNLEKNKKEYQNFKRKIALDLNQTGWPQNDVTIMATSKKHWHITFYRLEPQRNLTEPNIYTEIQTQYWRIERKEDK